jgi:ribonuclease P protein component
MKRYAFGHHEHLRKGSDFDATYRALLSARDSRLILHVRANGLTWSRLGFSVGGKFGNSVRRNRFRRICREAYRLHKHELPVGFDIIIRPAVNLDATLDEAAESLLKLAKRLCTPKA